MMEIGVNPPPPPPLRVSQPCVLGIWEARGTVWDKLQSHVGEPRLNASAGLYMSGITDGSRGKRWVWGRVCM